MHYTRSAQQSDVLLQLYSSLSGPVILNRKSIHIKNCREGLNGEGGTNVSCQLNFGHLSVVS